MKQFSPPGSLRWHWQHCEFAPVNGLWKERVWSPVASSAKVLPLQTCLNVYRALYESNLMYCASTWAGTEAKYLKQILGHQTRVLKNLFSLPRASHISPALKKHKILKTCDLLNREQIMVVHSMRMKLLPSPISGIVKPLQADLVDYRIARNSAFNMEQPRVNIKAFSHHSKPRLAIVWNQLPESVKSGPLQTFGQDLKEYYFSRYNSECDIWDCQTCHGWIFSVYHIMYFVHTHAQKYRLSTTVNCLHCICTLYLHIVSPVSCTSLHQSTGWALQYTAHTVLCTPYLNRGSEKSSSVLNLESWLSWQVGQPGPPMWELHSLGVTLSGCSRGEILPI